MLKRIVQCFGAGGMALLIAASPAIAESDPDTSKTMPPVPMREQVLQAPGDPTRPVTLEATLFEPPGDGPFLLQS
jgi:hypothetical protein